MGTKADSKMKLYNIANIAKKQKNMLLDEAVIYDRRWEDTKIDGQEIVKRMEESGFLIDDFKE